MEQATEPRVATPRSMPPSDLVCGRNDLTSYAGVVSEIEAHGERTRLVIRTDWDTLETVAIPHRDPGGPAWRYRVWSEPFDVTGEFQPRAGMRATAWICLDGETPPVIDWRPGERGPRGR